MEKTSSPENTSLNGVGVKCDTNAETETTQGILVRFLGCGAAGWKPELAIEYPYYRRNSSILVENKILFDFTQSGFDHLPEGCRPTALFITHSHGDHFNPDAIVQCGVKTVYVHSSWATAARDMLAQAAQASTPPRVIEIEFAQQISVGEIKVTAVPSTHSTSRVTDGILERTAMYLIEKDKSRLLYATDTAGIPGDAARMVGIDWHIQDDGLNENNPFVCKPQPLTALIMEATNGDSDEDFRIFVHSSVQVVERIVKSLKAIGRFTPPAGQKAIITHLGIKYRKWSSEEIEAEISPELSAAYDGLEIRLG